MSQARLALALGFVVALPRVAVGELRLNEVMYDVPGADGGFEYVELVSTSDEPVPLGGVTLERGNGSRADDWTVVWSGERGTSVPRQGLWVIGGERVVPAPDDVVELGLQNGPDGCRLLRDGTVIDVLGWGEHTLTEYYETSPAADVAAGAALGRVPDGRDTDDNAADWLLLEAPSPGAPNEAQRPANLVVLAHHTADHADSLHLDWLVESRRHVPVEVRVCAALCAGTPSCVAVRAGGAPVEGRLTLASAPADTTVCVTIDGNGWQDAWPVPVRVGPGPLRITEIMASPEPGAPEWFEVANAGRERLSLAAFAFEDARHEPVPLGSDAELAAGEVALIVESAVDAGDAFQIVPSSWPSLNDGGDVVRVIDGDGRTSDRVRYASGWAPAGASMERLGLDLPSSAPSSWIPRERGTPGRLPEPPPAGGWLSIALERHTAQPVVIGLAEPLADGDLRIFRADGTLVHRAGGAELEARTQLVWPASPSLRPGIYLVEVEGTAWRDGRRLHAQATIARTPPP